MITFIKNTTKEDVAEKNTIFLAICDGDYYLQKNSKTGDETKIKRLQRLTDGKTSFVLNIQEGTVASLIYFTLFAIFGINFNYF